MKVACLRFWLCLICAAYLGLAGVYNVMTPPFESADEVWHYPVVHHLANEGFQLPILNPEQPLPWRQQAAQPPLYYLLAAVLTAPIDTSDFEQVWRLNPHELGISVAGGVPIAVIHNVEAEAWPWRGTILAVHVARGLSSLFGLGTVLVSFMLARELFPKKPRLALFASALSAFLPMFVLVSASVSNDSLAIFSSNLALLLLVRLHKRETHDWHHYLAVGLAIGVSLLSKLSAAFLIPLVALVLAWRSWHRQTWQPFVVGGFISGSTTILVAGWWYLHNWLAYGDPTALNVFLDVVGRHDIGLGQLWLERQTLSQSTWGFVGAIYAPMPAIVYTIFNSLTALGLLSSLLFGVVVWRQEGAKPRMEISLVVAWAALTFIALIRWSLTTPAWQGRLLFGALSAYSIWIALGLLWWWPQRWRPLPVMIVGGWFFTVTALAPFTTIAPAFAPPSSIEIGAGAEPLASFQAPASDSAIALHSATVEQASIQSGTVLNVSLDWHVETETARDWSLFVHLINPEGVLIAQRDVYPGLNRMATSDLEAGRTWRDNIPIPIPKTAYAPQTLTVHVGWYHLESGERLLLGEEQTSYPIGTVELQAGHEADGIPNPVNLNFDDYITLLGYEVDSLSAQPSDTLMLTLYWQRQQALTSDYVVFANLIDTDTLHKVADSNAMPVQWQRPTSSWQQGEVIVDSHQLTIRDSADLGLYTIEVGLYTQQGESFLRLNLRDENGIIRGDVAHLTPVRVTD